MRNLIEKLFILDIAFQLLAKPKSNGWYLYFDFIHYGFAFAVCLYLLKEKRVPYYAAYFTVVLGVLVYKYLAGLPTDIVEPLYAWPVLMLFILSIYLIQEKWGKRTK